MEQGHLSWEAAAAGLEVVKWCKEQRLAAPSIAVVRWCWRVSMAAPDAPLDIRIVIARLLATWDLTGRPSDAIRGVEDYLAYAPWEEARRAEHKKAIDEHRVQPLNIEYWIDFDTPIELQARAMATLSGGKEETFRKLLVTRRREGRNQEANNGEA
jgi:hypothetical protein